MLNEIIYSGDLMFVFQFSYKEPKSVERLEEKTGLFKGVTIVRNDAAKAQEIVEQRAFTSSRKAADYLGQLFARV